MAELISYQNNRNGLLESIIQTLSNDERFLAGWLTGSLSYGNDDPFSDLDLTVVVSNLYSDKLCQHSEQVGAQTSPERLALFSQFGVPALIHENNNNAPQDGTFTCVLYSKTANMVDWVLIPQSSATRPASSKLLFEKAPIPVSVPAQVEAVEENQKIIAEQWAFFWMMTAITIKYIHRNDGVFATQWLENLHGLVHDIARRLQGKPWQYTRGSLSQLQPTREEQMESIRHLCQKMLELKPEVIEFIGAYLTAPLVEIETLLTITRP